MSSINVDGQNVPILSANFNGEDRRDATRLAKSEQGKRAAALATAEMVASFVGPGAASAQTQKNALSVLEELTPQLEEVTGQVSETEIVLPAGAAAPEPEPAAEAPSFTYEIPEDLASLFEDDEEEETAAVTDPVVEWEEDDSPTLADEDDPESQDPRVAQLQAQLAKERRKSDHERKLRVKASKKDWAAEAIRVFNSGGIDLVTPEELAAIDADSRKGFLRAAKAKADSNRTLAERFGARPAAPAPRPREEEIAEQREIWGQPAAAGAAVPNESLEESAALARARRSGNLKDILKARMFPVE